MKRIVFYIFFFSGLCRPIFSQIDSTSSDNQNDNLDNYLNNSSDEQNQLSTIEEWEFYKQHPVSINTITYDELTKIPFVSSNLAIKILLLRDTIQVTSFDQLLSIKEINKKFLQHLTQFITLESVHASAFSFSSLLPQRLEFRTRVEQKLQDQFGYQNGNYEGNNKTIYQRLLIQTSNTEIGGIFEKDAGENISHGFAGGYVSINDISFIKKIIVGNYSLSFGEGLSASRNMSTIKGIDVIGQIKRSGEMIRPTVSSDEFRYFQGTAGTIHFENVNLSLFYSQRNLPATIDSDGIVTSFYTVGLFRTIAEQKKSNSVTEKYYGGAMIYSFNESNIFGLNVSTVEYNKYLKSTLYEFEGNNKRLVMSLWNSFNFRSLSLFSEIATNDGCRFSKIFGSSYMIMDNISISLLHRAYSQAYINPFAHPFSERENISDGETGTYCGLQLRPSQNVLFSAYVDKFVLPSENQFDIIGNEFFIYSKISLSKRFDLMFHLRSKSKQQPLILTNNDERRQNNYRITYSFKISNSLSYTQRFEIVNVCYLPSDSVEQGFLTFAELSYRNSRSPLFIKIRFNIYETDSYDSRIYQFESDVQGNYSNPPLFGKGIRWYIVVGYEIIEKLLFSFKYSETFRPEVDVIGSGDDTLIGNLDNQFALQLNFEL
jgi:hypothetical protein